MENIKLYIIDDEALILKSLIELFTIIDGFDVVGSSKKGLASFDEIITLNPDILLLDLRLNGENGLQLTEKIQAEAPYLKVVILSGFCNENLIAMAMKFGASGYITKSIPLDEFIQALQKVKQNQLFVTCKTYTPFLENIKNDLKCDSRLYLLTKRETEILRLIVDEYTSKDIARKLQISEKTVRNHKANIMRKLNLNTDAGLVKYALYMAFF